jgi:hypothetical protein
MAISKIVTNSVDSGVTLTSPTLASPTISAPVLSGSVTGTYTLAGTPTAGASLITSGTAQATTSGTSKDFTGIPSWVKRITVMFADVSTGGTSPIRVQIGTSGGVIVSGYLGAATTASTGVGTTNFTAGFDECASGGSAAASIRHGSYNINMLSATKFVCTGILNYSNEVRSNFIAGSVTLSGTLDRVRITTSNGTDTFDAGSINILYE